MSVKELLDIMPERALDKDAAFIEKAYKAAEKAHEGDMRYSGDPHFTHVYATAYKLAELGMGAKTIAAGLLHDAIEDTDMTEEELEKEFGKEILFLVQGVTKLGHLRYHGAERHTESLRKLFVATSQDIRVLIIKFCDRLHNIRTLEHMPSAGDRDRIALETLEIYVPLAYRLGIRTLHREMEDYAFKHAKPDAYAEMETIQKERRPEAERRLSKIHKSMRRVLAEQGLTDVQTQSRIKGLYSLYKKIQRKGDIDNVYDIAALRVIVPNVSDCYTALGAIHGQWRPLPDRIRDYIAFPKPNGYQSIHTTIFTGDGGLVEVQIRSKQMHREAEFGIASHMSYKEGFSKNKINPNFLWLKQLLPIDLKNLMPTGGDNKYGSLEVPNWIKQLATEQTESGQPNEYIKRLKADFFERRAFIFTPKGDVIDLPIESTPIDFAYAVHSEIGNHVSGAKVNGKMVSLDTRLENGDIVEIETRKDSKPTAKWLEIAKTSLARRHIRQLSQNKD